LHGSRKLNLTALKSRSRRFNRYPSVFGGERSAVMTFHSDSDVFATATRQVSRYLDVIVVLEHEGPLFANTWSSPMRFEIFE
jgi:hypothetical protein